MINVGMNFKFLLGVSVFAVAIIVVIAVSMLEDESSLTEQEIRESIQNEILKSPKITGVHAQNICKILDFECPSNKTFQAVFDPSDEYTKFTYSKRVTVDTFATDYFFRIIDDELEYQTSRNTTEWITFVDADFDDSWMWDDDLTSNVSTQLKPYDYEDVCGYPVTDEMRLDAILEGSKNFSGDGYSYLTLRGAVFSHVELARFSYDDLPALNYEYILRNGQQIHFTISACNLNDPNMYLITHGPNYLKIKPETGETDFRQITIPGFPMVNAITNQPVLDIENCERITEYYTTMQSDTMFTEENVTFDPLWKNQLFPLMDYCADIGNYDLEIIDGKRNWSFTEK